MICLMVKIKNISIHFYLHKNNNIPENSAFYKKRLVFMQKSGL